MSKSTTGTTRTESRRFENRFENLVGAAQHSPKDWRDAVIAVADSAFMCRAWLEDHAPGWTPADLIAMTRLVVERETRQRDRDER